MHRNTHVLGIDPGIVHTGMVSVVFIPHLKEIQVRSEAIVGLDTTAARTWSDRVTTVAGGPAVFIEGYRPRAHMSTDKAMVEGVKDFRQAYTNSKVLDNTGIKTVVKPEVLKLLGIYDFKITTHHQDLRSAARILVLGMMKKEETNRLLADVVRDHLNNDTWKVSSR